MWRYEAWWVRSLDFPRLQLLVISTLLLLAEMILLDLSQLTAWGLLFATLLCIAYHAWWILPYTRFFPSEVKAAVSADSESSLRIMTANVLTPNRNAAELIKLVRENAPDILVTLESDSLGQKTRLMTKV
jgi:endonuclease/exonuclease/phosphatase (EEP) superfamily protein YafD